MIEEKLNLMNIKIPDAPKPLAAYIPATKIGNLVFTAGQIPLENGIVKYKGKVGAEITLEVGKESAKLCAINCLSVIKSEMGNLDKIKRIVKVTVFVNNIDGFGDQPKVANGASEFLVELFGESGKHVRSAVGVNGLPLGATTEVEMIVEV
ncbi:MAG: RidA family protein [Ignavibacteriae bacterium]|nr:RidA family protein [Ignavibacteriota bacterium]